MLIVAMMGLVVNLIGLRPLKGTHIHTEHTFFESTHEHNKLGKTDILHIQGTKLEPFNDLHGSVAIIIGAVLIYCTN